MTGPIAPERTRRDRGVTFLEVLVTLTMLAVVAGVTTNYAVEWIRRERLRSALYTISSELELTRVEALNRNRACRFVVDVADRMVRVLDLHVVSNPKDDEVLNQTPLPDGLEFASPDGADPITLDELGSGLYGATYDSGGAVSSGAGRIVILAGGRYGRVTLYVAGGTSIEGWRDGDWHAGF